MKREGYTITDYANFYDFTHKKWSNRNKVKITRIVPHHMAGNLTPDQFYSIMHSNRQMSPTVAVFTDGSVWAYVPEEMRPWTTGSWDADCCALTLEIANDGLADTGWHISDKAYNKAIAIMAEWCIRYEINPRYTRKGDGLNMHKDWAATACPGSYLEQIIKSGKMEQDIRKEVDKLTGRDKVEAFVSSLYKTILHREPDEKGLKYWVDNLMSKKMSAKQVVRDFFDSKEYLSTKRTNTQFVNDCYNAILMRKPDKNGREYWINELKLGKSRNKVLDGFLSSQEFVNFCKKYNVK